MMKLIMMMKRYAKAWAALVVGALADGTVQELLPERWRPWAQAIVTVATALGVAIAPANVPKASVEPAEAPL